MRSKSLTDLLVYEASRKPDIADLMNRVHEMSDEEIDSVSVPLPWYRQALKEIRKAKSFASFSAYVLANTEAGFVQDSSGLIKEWIGDAAFVELDRGQLEIKPGHLIFFPDTGGVWIDTLFSNKIDRRLISTKIICSATRSRYSQMRQERLNGTCVPEREILSPSGRELPFGIRISRIE